MSNFSFAPGRVKFEQVMIRKIDKAVDITALVAEVNILSSLVDPTTQGRFSFYDATNLLSNLPIEAGDVIELTIGFPDVQKTFKFLISKIENVVDTAKQRTYTIIGVSELAYKSFYTNISKHYQGATSDIALKVFKENTTEQFGVWEGSSSYQSLVIPYWNPIKSLQWLAKRSTSNIDTTRFYFWQDSNQIYHFAPIERMREVYKNKQVQKFTYGKVNYMIGQIGATKPNSEAAMATVESISFHDAFDIRSQIEKGRAGGVRFQTDLTSKVLDITTYNFWDSFKKDKSLNGNPSWARNNDMAKGMLQFDTVTKWQAPAIELNKVNDKSNIKQSSIDQSQFVDIVIKGNQTVDVGNVIELEVVSPEPITRQSKDVLDQRWSGKYYIVAKRDSYTRDGYKTALTLTKESLKNKEVPV